MTISELTTLDLNDEAIADRVSPDYMLLAPEDECLASGADGAFDAGDRWALTSATVDFESQGVSSGNLVLIELPTASARPGGLASTTIVRVGLFAVVEADDSALTVRRRRLAAGTGQPPGPIAGGTGYRFRVKTLTPLILDGADFVTSRYQLTSVDQIKSGSEGLCQRAAKLKAIINSYAAQVRQQGDETNDDFAAQRKAYQAELDELLKILDPIYGVFPGTASLTIGPLTATIFGVNRRGSCGDELGTPRRGCW